MDQQSAAALVFETRKAGGAVPAPQPSPPRSDCTAKVVLLIFLEGIHLPFSGLAPSSSTVCIL